MGVRAEAVVTPDGFLAWERTEEDLFELVDGHVVMMATGSPRHDALMGEVFLRLSLALRPGPCRVYTHSRNLRIGSRFRKPDVLVRCGPVDDESFEDDADYLVEILSPATAKTDVTTKLREYRTLPSLRQYLFMDPDARQVLAWSRHDLGWQVEEFDGGLLRFAGVEIDLDALYAFVDAQVPPPSDAADAGRI